MEHFAGKSSNLLCMKTLATVRCDILSYVATSGTKTWGARWLWIENIAFFLPCDILIRILLCELILFYCYVYKP